MSWYQYALLFYWAVSGFWFFLEVSDEPAVGPIAAAFIGILAGWLALPAALIRRALR